MSATASRGPGRPPAAKADDTRKRIVSAARQVFSERGYDGATFQAIAARADLTRPAINHYYSSKRVLYREVVDRTNEVVVGSALELAARETTLTGRLTAFIAAAVTANFDNPSASALLVTNVLESQRHPELNSTENDAVRRSREFLVWAVNDAIDRGEVDPGIDLPALTETLLVVLCGVAFYVGYLESPEKLEPVNAMLRQMLEGALWRSRA